MNIALFFLKNGRRQCCIKEQIMGIVMTSELDFHNISSVPVSHILSTREDMQYP